MAADGLMSQLVVMFTADGKLFVALSVIGDALRAARVHRDGQGRCLDRAQGDGGDLREGRPACADAFAAKIMSVATATGRVRSRLIQDLEGG